MDKLEELKAQEALLQEYPQDNIDQIIKLQEEIDELEYNLYLEKKPDREWHRAPDATELHDYKLWAPYMLENPKD